MYKLDTVYVLDKRVFQTEKLAESVKKKHKYLQNEEIVAVKNDFHNLTFTSMKVLKSKNGNTYAIFETIKDNVIVELRINVESPIYSELMKETTICNGTVQNDFYFYWETATTLTEKLILSGKSSDITHQKLFEKTKVTEIERLEEITQRKEYVDKMKKEIKEPNIYDELLFYEELDILYKNKVQYSKVYYLGKKYITLPKNGKSMEGKSKNSYLFLVVLNENVSDTCVSRIEIREFKQIPPYIKLLPKKEEVEEILSEITLDKLISELSENLRKLDSNYKKNNYLHNNNLVGKLMNLFYLNSLSDNKEESLSKYNELLVEITEKGYLPYIDKNVILLDDRAKEIVYLRNSRKKSYYDRHEYKTSSETAGDYVYVIPEEVGDFIHEIK